MAKLTAEQRARKTQRERERRAAKKYAERIGVKLQKGERLEDLYRRIDKEQQRQERNRRKRARYNETKRLLQESNIPKDIISKNGLRNKSPQTVQQFLKTYQKGDPIYTSKQWFALVYFDGSEESYIGHSLELIKSWNMEQKRDSLKNTEKNMERLKNHKQDYKFQGDYQMFVGTEADVKRAYADAMAKDYRSIVAPTNRFRAGKLLDIMAAVNDIVKPWRKAAFYQEMHTFTADNLPEIHKQIFG